MISDTCSDVFIHLKPPSMMKAVQNRLLSQVSKNFSPKIVQSPSGVLLKKAKSLTGYSSCLGRKWLYSENIRMMEILSRASLTPDDGNFVDELKKLLWNDYHFPWGLIILLISKSAEPTNRIRDSKAKPEIVNIQRSIAEVAEMLRSMTILHEKVQNLPGQTERNDLETLRNSFWLLIGDYLFAYTFQKFAAWKESVAIEIICSAIRDFTDVAYLGPNDSQNRFIPAKPEESPKDVTITVPDMSDTDTIVNISHSLGNAKKEWIMRRLLGNTILLSKCCQASLLIGGHPKPLQTSGQLLVSHLALANQASTDHLKFLDDDDNPFGLVNAPLMFHLQDNPDYYENLLEATKHQRVDYGEIKREVRRGNGLHRTRELVDELATKAVEVLNDFPDNDAKIVLRNIIEEF